MSTLTARLMFSLAALSMLPICLANPSTTAEWLRGLGGVGHSKPEVTGFESVESIRLPRPRRLRMTVRGRDGVWTSPE